MVGMMIYYDGMITPVLQIAGQEVVCPVALLPDIAVYPAEKSKYDPCKVRRLTTISV